MENEPSADEESTELGKHFWPEPWGKPVFTGWFSLSTLLQLVSALG